MKVRPSQVHAAAPWVAAWLAVATSACNDADKRFVELSNQGIEALDAEDYSRADGLLKDALKIKPADADVRFYLGTIALRGGQFEDAIGHLSASLQGDPTRPEAHLSLAKAHYEHHQPKEALAALAELFKRDAGHPQGHFLAAKIARAAKDRALMDKALRNAIAGDVGFVPAFQLLSQLYVEVGAYEAARQVLQEGLRFNADAVELREALGLVMLDLGRPDRARQELEAASAMTRARPQVYFSLAGAQLQLGERAAAVTSLKAFLIQSQGVLAREDPLRQQAANMILKLRAN
ncbi:MAG: tetratricopeptide repeat protein [Deltaproteobacteria bacterium]|nr:tetratricopeptide repeat protein [Deltaproteobacteria bacterium]